MWPLSLPMRWRTAGQVGRAEKILADLYRSFPTDNELAQALKDLSARKTLDEGGYEALADGSGSYRDILKNKEEAVSLEQQNRQVKTEDVAERLINEYETRLKTEPKNLKLLRSLAELCTQKKQFDRALGYYEQIKASEVGGDASLDRSIADTMVRKFDHQISLLDSSAPDYADKVGQASGREAGLPTGRVPEARGAVLDGPANPVRAGAALLPGREDRRGHPGVSEGPGQPPPAHRSHELSGAMLCPARINDLAARTLQGALKEKAVFDDEKKELIYNSRLRAGEAWARRRKPSSSSSSSTTWISATKTSPRRWMPITAGNRDASEVRR